MTMTPEGSRLPQRVLAVGAHPDDIELLCAGTLARFIEAGCAVQMTIACRGDRGGSNDPAWGARREAEARASAAMLGAEIELMGFGDADVWDTPEARTRFISMLRRARPDLVLTHGPNDYHADHVQVGDLVSKCAWFAASVGHTGDEPALASAPTVMYMDNIAGIAFEPTHMVDITGTIELKRRMFACHASQSSREDAKMNELDEMLVVQGRLRGVQAGVRYAEGFRPAFLMGRRRPEPIFPG